MITIRKALLEDIASITEIYNEAILNTTATFDTHPKTIENRKEWLLSRNENFPILVAEKESRVIGFVALSKWSDKQAYDITAEISLYIHTDFRNQGIGKKLLEMIINIGTQTNLVSIIARITQGNEQSIYLHLLNGFEKIGVMRKVGKKFGETLDVTLLQKML